MGKHCIVDEQRAIALSQKGFELANGLPFVASDGAIHNLLDEHTVAESQQLQIALGKIRQTFGHFSGRLLAVDPHRIRTYSNRQMVRRREDNDSRPAKIAQTFFCLDADTKQPVCFTTGTSARTVTQATPELLKLTNEILNIGGIKPLVLADNEHYSSELLDWMFSQSPFEMLVPVKKKKIIEKVIEALPTGAFTRHWAGYATTKTTYHMKNSTCGSYYLFIQRNGERKEEYSFEAFLCTGNRNEMETQTFPQFNVHSAWKDDTYFSAPIVSPFTKCFCTRIVKITTGTSASIPPAVMYPQLIPVSFMKPMIPTGSVTALVPVRIRANKNSFHEKIKMSTAVAARPGATRGRAIFLNTANSEHPSISALSSIARGISSKKPFIIQTTKGRLKLR